MLRHAYWRGCFGWKAPGKGFEPLRPAWATGSQGRAIEIFMDFERFLRIDRQLGERTVERHLIELRRLFENSDFNPLGASKPDIRSYLMKLRDMPPNSYANVLKTLRIFYRDYLGRKEIVEGFEFPNRPMNLVKTPSKKELREFYNWLKEPMAKALFLLYASTGLRRNEALNLRFRDIDFEKRMIIPNGGSRTKKTWVTFYNEEAEKALKEYLGSFNNSNKDAKLFPASESYFRKQCRGFEKERGIRITPQVLREWFSSEMGRLGVQDRFIDAFSGRVPRSVLARHYTDYSPERLKEIYDKAGLKVLED
jgi:integrase